MHPIFCAHLVIFLELLNLDIITSTPPLACLHCLFVCYLQFKQISFLYVQTLHNDCSHTEDVHRRRRSRAEFGHVLSPLSVEIHFNIQNFDLFVNVKLPPFSTTLWIYLFFLLGELDLFVNVKLLLFFHYTVDILVFPPLSVDSKF